MSASFDVYKVFYYVGKYMNITHAANALFLSQSTVSRAIQSLESELGCRLFERTQHGVSFTAEGEMLYAHVSKGCESIFDGEERIRRMQQLGEGSVIRIGVNDFTFQQYILPVLKDFHNDFPQVKLEVEYISTDINEFGVDTLSTKDIDLACLSLFSAPTSPDFASERLLQFNDIVIAGKGFEQLKTGSHSLRTLVAYYPFVMQGHIPQFLNEVLMGRGIILDPTFKVSSLSLFIPMVKMGLCLALVPDTYRFDADDIFKVQLSDPIDPRYVWLLSSNRKPNGAVRSELIKRIHRYTAIEASRW
ncbi:MAG: LysR family transcriptional regulator [Oscillospiraceae bacterium]|nr:LysR family transcriptional regulator [Oscillospiraceae bacterium]